MTLKARRTTYETDVEVLIDIDGSGNAEVSTGVELLDDMLKILAASGRFDLKVSARGDEAGDHHAVEDVGITLGRCLSAIKSGTASCIVPHGDCTALVAVSFGTPSYKGDIKLSSHSMGGMALENLEHFMRSMAYNGRFTLHLFANGGDDREKIISVTKALGRAIKDAIRDGQFEDQKL